MSIIWRIIGAVSLILGIIGKKKKEEIPESITGRFWSIIDLSLYTHLNVNLCSRLLLLLPVSYVPDT